jgi:C4-dicarboxylate-specific signal transduction histidine kinase
MSSYSHQIISNPELVIEFLEANEASFLSMWQEQIMIGEMDSNKDQVRENGHFMYELVERALLQSINEAEMKQLATKVAKERVEAGSNIGEFVYNVNVGRSIIIKYVLQSELTSCDLPSIINTINELFDQFCFHAVTIYTELKNHEMQQKNVFLTQTHKDKLAILGQMSSSFVHEFRNPLTSIIGFNKLLRIEYPNLKYLDIIELELDQLKFRITQFLHTSKMDLIDNPKENVTLKNLLDNILSFIYPSIVDSDVLVSADIDPTIMIEAYKDELKQVFLNVLFNSIDAVQQRKRPREINVRCFRESDQVIIEVANNGPAIPPEVKETIFEPFYTTKDLGTGIGLFVCKNIIEKHAGYMTCDSNDTLTTFRIYLPLST